MSVAFRREQDDEHLEPKFELPIPAGPNLVTARGLALIEAKVVELQAGLAASPDEVARTRLARELRYWLARRVTAQPAPPPPEHRVGFGARVRLLVDGRERTISIVGDDEADPSAGLIAFSAPLARTIMDAEPGERVAFGGRADALHILAIGEDA